MKKSVVLGRTGLVVAAALVLLSTLGVALADDPLLDKGRIDITVANTHTNSLPVYAYYYNPLGELEQTLSQTIARNGSHKYMADDASLGDDWIG